MMAEDEDDEDEESLEDDVAEDDEFDLSGTDSDAEDAMLEGWV